MGRNDGDPGSNDGEGTRRTRRGYLAALAATAAVGVAGCSGGGGGNDDGGDGNANGGGEEPTATSTPTTTRTRTTTESGCGPASVSYRTVELSRPGTDGPLVTIELPEDASVREDAGGAFVEMPYGNTSEFYVEMDVMENETVEGIIEDGQVEPDDEITGRFDLGGAGRRVFTRRSIDADVPRNTLVYVPDGEDLLYFSIEATFTGCERTDPLVYERMITSVDPV